MSKADELLAKAAEQEAQVMTLLLTTARILRARLKDAFETTGLKTDLDDWNDMQHALAPFDPLGAEPINEATGAAQRKRMAGDAMGLLVRSEQ
jgi:hypothetical protein